MPFSVIQGASEVGARLSENEVQESLDFCFAALNAPASDDDDTEVSSPALDTVGMSTKGPEVPAKEKEGDSEAKSNGVGQMREMLRGEFKINGLEAEGLDGYAIRLEKGSLGLKKV